MSLLAYHQFELIYQNSGADVSVYRAYNKATQTPVAIKQLLCTSIAQANAAIAESLIQARLSHPHICSVFECFLQEQGAGFLAVIVVERMESDLFHEITRRAERQEYWSEREVVQFLEELAGALAYAETLGVAHRDIKPHNLLLSAEGRVKIGDFGSAAFSLERNLRDTLQGTPFFLSPELKLAYLNSLTGSADTSSYNPYLSDVYSLGLTVLHMALLQIPTALAVLERLEEHTVETLEKVAQWPTLQSILYYMLAVDPTQRPSFQYIAGYCRNQLGSQEPQAVLSSEATASLSRKSSGPVCLACNSLVSRNTSWQDDLDPEIKACSELLARVCSKVCFIATAAGKALNPNACLLDCKLLGSNRLLLDCGHGFCSQGCLSKYLVNEPINEDQSVSLKCKLCQRNYEEGYLRHFYQKNATLRDIVRSGRSRAKCQHCNQRCADITLDCKHSVALNCAALIQPPKQPARLICPVCCKSQVWNNS